MNLAQSTIGILLRVIAVVYTIEIYEKTLIVKVDPKIKDEITRFAKNIGVPVSIVVNAVLKEVIRTQMVVLSLLPGLSPYSKVISKAINQHRDRSVK